MVIAWEQKDHDFARKMAIIKEPYQNVECMNDMFRSDVVYISASGPLVPERSV